MLISRGFGERPNKVFSGFELDVQFVSELEIYIDLNGDLKPIIQGESMYLKFKQGEGKTFAFKMFRGKEDFLELVVSDLTFVLKLNKTDTEPVIARTKEDFEIVDNVARVSILSSETKDLPPGVYIGELTVIVSDSDTIKSVDLEIEIERAVSV